jgi:hypothetical protein
MKNFEKNEEENFESMDSTFTPIGRAYFKKSKIEVLRLNPSLQLELSLGGY